MKRGFLLVVFLLAVTPLVAQQSVDSRLAAIARVQKQNVATRQSYTFRQTKHSPMFSTDVVSNGTMTVGPARYLVWQYSGPNGFSLVVDGDSVYTVSGGRRAALSGSNGRTTRRMAYMMMQLVEGESLLDNGQFSTALSETAQTYVVMLTPLRRDMRRMMQSVSLTFDKQAMRIQTVRIEEGNDSFTLIEFEKK